jgi:bacterioferritin-associated ferredoxin
MNLDPVLMCGRCRVATQHIFVERRAHPRALGEAAFFDLFYECDVCSAVRPWGNEPRQESAYGRRLAEETLSHAIDAHGMRRERCSACRGVGFDCSECGDDGQVWIFDNAEPCGPTCPIAGFESAGNE